VNGVKITGTANIMHGVYKLPSNQYSKLSNPVQLLASASIGQYAIFGGGTSSTGFFDNPIPTYSSYTGFTTLNKAYVYNSSLTYSESGLRHTASKLAGANVGNYALFAGGFINSSKTIVAVNRVSVIDTSLTTSEISQLPDNVGDLAGTNIGNYALFAGGYSNSSSPNTRPETCAYNSSLVKNLNAPYLSIWRSRLAATTIGDNAIFAGGFSSNNGGETTAVDVYTTSLTKSTADPLSVARHDLTATTVGNYALFAGGQIWRNAISNNTYYATVDTYNASLVKSFASSLSIETAFLSSTNIGHYAVIYVPPNPNDRSNNGSVNIYDEFLTKSYAPEFYFRYNTACANTGNYAIFVGGVGGDNLVLKNFVDVYYEL
jgi:hypothetical protein